MIPPPAPTPQASGFIPPATLARCEMSGGDVRGEGPRGREGEQRTATSLDREIWPIHQSESRASVTSRELYIKLCAGAKYVEVGDSAEGDGGAVPSAHSPSGSRERQRTGRRGRKPGGCDRGRRRVVVVVVLYLEEEVEMRSHVRC